MSTRLHIAVVTTVILTLALGLVSLALYFVLSFSLHTQLDRSLATEGQELRDYFFTSADSPLLGATRPVSTPYEAVAPSGSVFRLVAADGRVVARSLGDRAVLLDASAYQATSSLPPAGGYETIHHAGAAYRVYALPVVLPANTQGLLQLARPLAAVEATLANLRFVLLAGAGVSLLFAVGLGLLVAHVAAKPIEDVASATARIRAFGEDDERLVLGGHLQEPHWLAQSLNNLLDRVAVAEAAAGEASAVRAQCAAYVQRQLGRLIAQQRELNDFMRTELRPGSPDAQELTPAQRGAARDFLQADPRGWSAAYDDVVAWLDAQTEALTRWLDHLPLYVGAQTGLDVEPEEVALSPLLADICQDRSAAYGDRLRLAWQWDCEPLVRADPAGLREALTAVIDHACGATPAGGAVTVTLDCGEDYADITVNDSGPGIMAEDLPLVFTRSAGAAGANGDLGLPFAHDVIAQHGGTITVERAPGAGSAFTIRLPREGSRAQPAV